VVFAAGAGVTLREILAARIAATGPMTLADYMAECLLHPTLGYYTTRDPFGAAGDFITAPEISQMFGELIGLSLAQAWLDQGQPAGVLAELGPGRGTLMADILRATRAVPGFHAAMRVHLVEASPVLRARQRAVLAGQDVTWCATCGDRPSRRWRSRGCPQLPRRGRLWNCALLRLRSWRA
jgi:NADH dehydrogenase [ubiquinone] 1 alpha subcomplex assembly factor 7